MVEPLKIFFVMPIYDEDTAEHKKFKHIFEIIKTFITNKIRTPDGELLYICKRADEDILSEDKVDLIIKQLFEYDRVIADLTNSNANVFYELGIRHSLQKLGTILIVQQGKLKELPFDIKSHNVFKYPKDTELYNESKWEPFLIKIESALAELMKSPPNKSDSPVYNILGEKIGRISIDVIQKEKYTSLLKEYKNIQDIIDAVNYKDYIREIEHLKLSIKHLEEDNSDIRAKNKDLEKEIMKLKSES